MRNPDPHDFETEGRQSEQVSTPCAVCGLPRSAWVHRPPALVAKAEPHDFQMLTDELSPRTTCAVCGNIRSASIHRPPQYIIPELQIKISPEGIESAVDVLRDRTRTDDDEQIVQKVVAAALAAPPSVTEKTVEQLTRALTMTYPTAEAWANANRRQLVEGLLLSLGVEVSSQP